MIDIKEVAHNIFIRIVSIKDATLIPSIFFSWCRYDC